MNIRSMKALYTAALILVIAFLFVLIRYTVRERVDKWGKSIVELKGEPYIPGKYNQIMFFGVCRSLVNYTHPVCALTAKIAIEQNVRKTCFFKLSKDGWSNTLPVHLKDDKVLVFSEKYVGDNFTDCYVDMCLIEFGTCSVEKVSTDIKCESFDEMTKFKHVEDYADRYIYSSEHVKQVAFNSMMKDWNSTLLIDKFDWLTEFAFDSELEKEASHKDLEQFLYPHAIQSMEKHRLKVFCDITYFPHLTKFLCQQEGYNGNLQYLQTSVTIASKVAPLKLYSLSKSSILLITGTFKTTESGVIGYKFNIWKIFKKGRLRLIGEAGNLYFVDHHEIQNIVVEVAQYNDNVCFYFFNRVQKDAKFFNFCMAHYIVYLDETLENLNERRSKIEFNDR